MYYQVETILLSIISMLSSPNDESPANIDAAVSGFQLKRSCAFFEEMKGLHEFQRLTGHLVLF
jgi:hypothetical protein